MVIGPGCEVTVDYKICSGVESDYDVGPDGEAGS